MHSCTRRERRERALTGSGTGSIYNLTSQDCQGFACLWKRHHGVHSLRCRPKSAEAGGNTNALPLCSHCPASRGPGDSHLHQVGNCLPGLGQEDRPPPVPSAFWREKNDVVSMKEGQRHLLCLWQPRPCYSNEKGNQESGDKKQWGLPRHPHFTPW